MLRKLPWLPLVMALSLLLISSGVCVAQPAKPEKDSSTAKTAPVSIPEGMGDVAGQQATRVREQLEKQAHSLFERQPPGWGLRTISNLGTWIVTMPARIQKAYQRMVTQSRAVGFAGSIALLMLIPLVLYALIGRRRLRRWVERELQSIRERIPESWRGLFDSVSRVLTPCLAPFFLFGILLLINEMIARQVSWFVLLERWFGLWAFGALAVNLLRELLLGDRFAFAERHGKELFRPLYLVLIYGLIGTGLLWSTEVFGIPKDVFEFLRFLVSLSIVLLVFLLLLKKEALLSLLPEMDYGSYRFVVRLLHKFYFILVSITLLTGLLWCFGYRALFEAVLTRTWAVAAAYVFIMVFYNAGQRRLHRWAEGKDKTDEEAQFFYRAARGLLLYATITVLVVVIADLIGLLNPLQRVLSFPLVKIGDAQLSFWIILKAAIILLAFVFFSRLLQAYLDYKVYPSLGIEQGLAYALNTFLKYLLLIIGFLFSLRIVGLDLRVLMVFAGAIGIGIGLGLQNLAGNLISGLSIIFGGKLRKGDWIQVGDTIGTVTDISLGATKIRTRDSVEYVIPNADFMTNTVINYTLSSPMVRISVPIGVSYQADPLEVKKIIVDAVKKHEQVIEYQEPELMLVGYGDNSVDFELLVWMDIRRSGRRRVRSLLYYSIFEALREAGIEIPFPQRDLHIRSGFPPVEGPRESQPPLEGLGSPEVPKQLLKKQ